MTHYDTGSSEWLMSLSLTLPDRGTAPATYLWTSYSVIIVYILNPLLLTE